MYDDTAFAVVIFKAMADETRFEIIKMLSQGEMCACKILEKFNFTQPTLSYHMRILTAAGLVNGVREGAWIWYSLNRETFEKAERLMGALHQAAATAKQVPCCEEYSKTAAEAHCCTPDEPLQTV